MLMVIVDTCDFLVLLIILWVLLALVRQLAWLRAVIVPWLANISSVVNPGKK